MTSSTEEIYQIMNGKYGLKYQVPEVEVMRKITKA
jgi:hypothetical protein